MCHAPGLTSAHSSSSANPVTLSTLIFFPSSLLHLPPKNAVLNSDVAHFKHDNPLTSSAQKWIFVYPSAAVKLKWLFGLFTENAAGAHPWHIPIHLSTDPYLS